MGLSTSCSDILQKRCLGYMILVLLSTLASKSSKTTLKCQLYTAEEVGTNLSPRLKCVSVHSVVSNHDNSYKKLSSRREAARCFVSVNIASAVQYLERSFLSLVTFGFRFTTAYN